MTIALGVSGHGGLVIAADTLESYGYAGAAKLSTSKITCFYDNILTQLPDKLPKNQAFTLSDLGGCAITGAGDSEYVEYLTRELGATFLDKENQRLHGESLRIALEKPLRKFHARHIARFYPAEAWLSQVQLLLGIQRGIRHPDLLIATRTTLRNASPFAAVGAGAQQALLLLDRLWTGDAIEDLTLLAAYVLYAVKETVEGCGKNSQIVQFPAGKLVEASDGTKRWDFSNKRIVDVPQPVILEMERRIKEEYEPAQRDAFLDFAAKYRDAVWVTQSAAAPTDPAAQ